MFEPIPLDIEIQGLHVQRRPECLLDFGHISMTTLLTGNNALVKT